MREIKYKIWDKTHREWRHGGDYAIMLDGSNEVLKYTGLNDSTWELVDEWDYEVVQYTGSKDRNGIEIYEGDILEYTCRSKREKADIWFNGYLWEIRDFYNPVYDHPEDAFSEGTKKLDLVIIGNIYENPELLKA